MATSSRQTALFGTNDWTAIYKTFREADFKSYDYETLRKSFIDYLRVNYPETFNDYIESSEFIALLDVIAFTGQGLAFRNDLNTRENFIDTAERRDSVVKLANLVNYTPKRNLAGQGYLKVVSIKTSQQLVDINGINLSNVPVLWNDPANVNWLDQYNTVINAALVSTQRIGHPGHSEQILGVKTDEYSLSIPQTNLPVVPFTASVEGTSMNFELVSTTSVGSTYMYEPAPGPTNKFNVMYRNDKLGFGSPSTGFFCYFKQGQLRTSDFKLTQHIANQVVPIDIQGVNDTDTWLYEIAAGGNVEWKSVDNVFAEASLQTEEIRRIFSVVSGFNDRVSYTFGDGVFSEIPIGTFRAYVRSSNALTYSIDPAELQGVSVTIPYVNRAGRTETLTLGLELQTPVSNAQARETLANIKQRAPTKYYTQNRMVNGEDYNNFPYALYNSIIKSKAVNRSSVGISRNLDLIDPTGKYSSANSFASDGAMYLDSTSSNTVLSITSTGHRISFLSVTLAAILSSSKSIQYYIQNFPRYDVSIATQLYWSGQTVDANSLTGYFYSSRGGIPDPIPTGTYSTTTAKYITKGALLKFSAPDSYFFDQNNRLVYGIPQASDSTTIWTTAINVIGDGFNNGQGAFANGTGPITLSEYIPTGAKLLTVIPAFSNSLPEAVIQECIIRLELQQSFSLVFDNSLTVAQNRWSVGSYVADFNQHSNVFVNFANQSTDRYSIATRALSYYFGSVAETRFIFESGKLVYDPLSGKILQDHINVLASNQQPGSTAPLARAIRTSIIGQANHSDGYANDFEVEVANIDTNHRDLTRDPDFFNAVTGYVNGAANLGIYAFFEQIVDAANLTRNTLISSASIVHVYPNKTQIEVVKYEYAVGQVFYAYAENVFYQSVQDNTVQTVVYTLDVQTQYSMKPGRQGLAFQYKHNSNNTTRINPATTNIIDLYLVTHAYYDAYRNWIQDSTDTLIEPTRPTINELNQAYEKLQDYKMISDSVILNSVIFKPMYGPKADPALRATVKVVRSATTTASDSEIRSATLTAMNAYFDVNNWNFGDTFYFSELSAYLHSEIGSLINSVVLVPNDPAKSFGDLYEVKAAPYEIFVNGATTNDIVVISSLTSAALKIR